MAPGGNNRSSKSNEASISGEWVTPPVSYVDPKRRFCEFCGRPIARRFWRTETKSEVGIFCDPSHAVLYTTYPLSPNTGHEQ